MAQYQVIAGRAVSLRSQLASRITRMSPAMAWLIFVSLFLGFGPVTNYSPVGFLDPWIPTGYFLNFSDMMERFGIRYYITRTPYAVIGLTFYNIFTPEVANWLMNVFFLWLSCIGFYFSTRRIFNFGPAVLVTTAFATNNYTLSAMAWDYPDGCSIAFLLVGLWLAIDPPRLLSGWRGWVGVGFFWGMAGAVNLIAGLVILPLCLIVVASAGIDWREWRHRAIWIIVGVLAMLLVFGVISYFLFGIFWFMGPQIGQLIYSLATPGYLSSMWGTGLAWLLPAYRLAGVFSIAVAALAVLLFIRNRRDRTAPAFIILAAFLATIILFALVEFGLNAVVLRVFYTSSYIVVPTFLAMAAVLHLLMRDDRSEIWGVRIAVSTVVGLILVAYVTPWIFIAGNHFPRMLWWVAVLPAVLIVVAALVGPRRRFHAARAAALALVILPVGVIGGDAAVSYVKNTQTDGFDAAVKVSDVLRSGAVKGRTIRFWFDNGEPMSQYFHSIASLYLWGWRDLTKEFPTLPQAEIAALLPGHITMVHLTSEPEKIRQREALMTSRGMTFEPARNLTIVTKAGQSFTISLQDAKLPQPGS